MRRELSLSLWLVGFFAFWLIVTMPLDIAWRWFGPNVPGLSFNRVAGTLWQGRFEAVRLRGIDLGDVGWRLVPWPLATGTMVARLTPAGGAVVGQAVFERGLAGGAQLTDTRLRVDLAKLPTLLAVSGRAVLDVGGVGFRGEACMVEHAHIDIEGLTISLPQAPAPWRADQASAKLGCAAGRLAADIDARHGAGRLGLRAELAADLSYRLTVRVNGVDPAMVPALEMAGFEEDGGRYELVQWGGATRQGRWQAP